MAQELQNKEQIINEIAAHYKAILQLLGEDVTREGLVKTPERAAKALLQNTQGYSQNADDIINSAIFNESGSKIVVVKDIEYYSLCEHHILPFFGTVTIGYMPDEKIVGLSKLGRIVDTFARRLQVQERLTSQICDTIHKTLSPAGAIVLVHGQHLCMKMRGVEKQQSTTVTLRYCGAFDDVKLRNEFFELLRQQK